MSNVVWHVLIVDDSPGDRAEVRRLLLNGSERRYTFTEAETGAAGLRALRREPTAQHQCVVLDYYLPDMDAPAFLQAISGTDGAPDCPVVVVTAGDSAATGRSAIRAGAHDYVGKEWMTQQVMVRAIENASERWAMARDLRQQSAAAQCSEMHFQALAQATSDIVYSMSADWSVMQPLDGRALVPSADTPLEGWAWLEQNIPADEHARVRQAISEAMATRSLFTLEHRVRRPDGSTGWTLSRAVPILDANGTVLEWFGASADITARVEAERALRRSESFLLRIAAITPGVLHVFDLAARRAVFINRSVASLLGFTPDQVTAMGSEGVATLMHPDDMPRFEQHLARVRTLADGEIAEFEHRMRDRAGVWHWFHTCDTVFERDDAGAARQILGVALDMTARKDAEEALARREQELQTLADNTPDILARFDRQLRHLFVNAAVERVTGLVPADFIGKTNLEIGMPVALCELWDAALTAVFENGHTLSREFTYQATSGTRHFLCTLIPERGSSGDVMSVLGVTRDRTNEKQAQDALLAADRRKDEFLATLAHELRNPLAPLRTGLKVLQLSQDSAIVERTQLMMERQLGQTVRLIDDLLDISRITSGKFVLRPARIELQVAIHAAIEAVQPLLDAAAQGLALDMPSAPVWINADPTRISQVVNNLLTNAAKYSPHGSSIALRLHRLEDTAVVTVTDSGDGIPQSMLGQIFEMFTQVDRSLDRAQGGLGIGLALVRRLVEMQGGTVSAESPGLGAGSTFTLRLPMLGEPLAQLDQAVLPPVAATPDTRLRVLVVDDNADAAESLADLLSLYGHETRIADCGPAALDIAGQFKPAVVFLDIGMPGMNGYETARRLRAGDPSSGMTLVALTGWGAEGDRIKSKDAGFDHHFTKPAEIGRLEKVLEQVAMQQTDGHTG